jgi:dihydroorotate dehydrogenase
MMTRSGYEAFVRPLLFALPAETAHHLALNLLRIASPVPWSLRGFAPSPRPTTVFGLRFPNPIGLAAGFDKNGVALPAWEALGFGFVEIGTITARAQPGNPMPRIFRYPEQKALINRLGFNNDGADAIAARLRALRGAGRWPRIPVGINIGKSKVTPLENAAEDYLYSFRVLHSFADYIVLNVSSPNTPGLRSLQEHEALVALLRVIAAENRTAAKPILVKIAPDLSDDELGEVIRACEANGIAGLVATNTTLDHSAIPVAKDQTGGLSGLPLRDKATRFIRAIRAQTTLPIIGVGGISDATSTEEKFQAGAQLLQVYTGYIYKGPALLRELQLDATPARRIQS